MVLNCIKMDESQIFSAAAPIDTTGELFSFRSPIFQQKLIEIFSRAWPNFKFFAQEEKKSCQKVVVMRLAIV